MENLIVATFQNKDDASEAVNQLKELNELEDIIIYNIVMVQKKEDQIEVLYHEGPDTRDMPAESAFVGSLIGAIGGPVGMAIGMLTGVMVGAVNEDDTEAFIHKLMEKVNKRLQPGSYAIVMDIEEYAELFVDSYLESHQATVVRTPIADQYENFNREQWEQFNKQMDAEEERLKTATDQDKMAIKEKIKDLKAKRDEAGKKFKARRADLKKIIQDRIASLNQKIATANGQTKERLKARKEKLEGKIHKWNEKVASVLL
jgi:uncharacterized membrane protein